MRAIDVLEAVRMSIVESADGENGADMATLRVLHRNLVRMARVGKTGMSPFGRCLHCDRWMTGNRDDALCPVSSGSEQCIPCEAAP